MKKRILFLSLFFIFFAVAAYILGWSNLLTVKSVEIKGATTLKSSMVYPGQRLARIETRAIAKEFEALDWVKRADVSRGWMSGKVVITITKRIPIAIYNSRAIDIDGVDFAPGTYDVRSLPRILASTVEFAIKATAFFNTLPKEFAQAIVLLKASDTETYILELQQGARVIEIRWGQASETPLKIQVYRALIQLPENSLVKVIDLSAPHSPIVK